MKTLMLTAPEKAKPEKIRALAPKKLSGWRIETLGWDALDQIGAAPDVTMVEISDATKPAAVKAMIPRLAHIQAKAPKRSHVVFSFKERVNPKPPQARAQERFFHAVTKQLKSYLVQFPNPQLVDVSFARDPSAVATFLDHLRAKLDIQLQLLDSHLPAAAARPSPLDQMKQVVESTQDLRVASGNISAERVAELYNVSVSELAGWLGKSRQAVNKTPDAESLQPALSFFERVARLRLALKTDAAFRKWLRTPQHSLDNESPLQVMAKGEWQVVADLVDDALTGAPT